MEERKNVYLSLHKSFVREGIEYTDRATGEARTFNSATLPKGTVVDGVDESCAITAWGGAGFNPYGILWCYATNDAKNEYGFDPYTETCTVNLSGKDVTKSYNAWYEALTNGEYSTAESDVKNTILAACEKGLLSYYNMIPIQYLNSCALISQRTKRYSDHYINELVSNPVQTLLMTELTMDDDEWAAYCKEQNNQLNY